MLTVNLQSFSLFFPLVFSIFLGAISEYRIILFPLSLPDGAEYPKMVKIFWGARDAAVVANYFVDAEVILSSSFCYWVWKAKNHPKKSRSFLRSELLGLDGDGGSEDDCFYLRDKKRDLVPLFVTKAYKDMCTLTVSPWKVAGVFHLCLFSSPWKLLGVPIATLHKSCDSFPDKWGKALIMGIKGMHLPDWQLECKVLQYLPGILKGG